ncbi:MAG: helix-turn-helix transcriptional regulator [Anaerolineales bacterium]|nr:helix-turn-helix transcriptional regulator [Anaerolineales bacterium]
MVRNEDQWSVEQVRVEEDALIDFQFAVIDALNERGWSRADLASLIGVSRARVSQLLSSGANPTLKLVGRVSAALNLTLRYTQQARPGSDAVDREADYPLDEPQGEFRKILQRQRIHAGTWRTPAARPANQNSAGLRKAA